MAITPTVETIGDAALTDSIIDRSITEIQDSKVKTLAPYSLAYCSSLKKGVFEAVTQVSNNSFYYDDALEELDFHSAVSFDASALQSLSALKTLVLRSNTLCSTPSNAFLLYTPINYGDGYIYVPRALTDAYKSTFGWSDYASQIRVLEEYTVDGTTTGALDPLKFSEIDLLTWEGVAATIAVGSYAKHYTIGDSIPLDLGGEGLVNMQVAAFDADDLADGSGKAAITFIAKELLTTTRRANPSRAGSAGAYTEGTGGVGGWEKCELRSYLRNTIKPMMPSHVASMIVAVNKTQTAVDAADTKFTQTTADDVWVLDRGEFYYSGGMYRALFPDAASRIKYPAGTATKKAWWLRGPSDSSGFTSIYTSGSAGTYPDVSSSAKGVCLCFCVGKAT